MFQSSWGAALALVAGLALMPTAAEDVPVGPHAQPWLIIMLNVAAFALCLARRGRSVQGLALVAAAGLATLSELCTVCAHLQLAGPVYAVLALTVVLLTVHQGSFERPWRALLRSHREVVARKAAVQAALGSMPDAMLAVDRERRVSVINPACCRLLAVDAATMLGADPEPLMRPVWGEHADALFRDIDAVLAGREPPDDAERVVRVSVGGGDVMLEHRLAPAVDAKGGITGAVLLLRDVSEHWGLRERLEAADDHVRTLLDSSLDPVLLVNPAGIIVDLNPAVVRLTGRDRDSLLGRDSAEVFGDPDGVRIALRSALACGSVQSVARELARADGEHGEALCHIAPCSDARGEVKGAFVVIRSTAAADPAAGAASCDALTMLPNRRLFRDRLEEAIARSRRSGQSGAVLFIDLDDFKDVNDALGHGAGDELLKVVARRLCACLRGSDILARIGGDEFALLAEHLADPEDARMLAERLLAAVREPVQVAGAELAVTCSVGGSVFPFDLGGADALLRNADTAMFRAKEAGKNNSQFFSYDMSRSVRRRVEIRTHLRNAIRHDELSVVYQPRMVMEGNELAGAEALLRWNSAELGPVGPQEFIPVAEEAGLIVPIGEWVLREACAQAVRWRLASRRDVSVAVNISARQFRDTDIVKTVMDVLAETGLPSRLLELELTESVLMCDTARAVDTLQRLNAIGVRVALDDFGTGYSSLSYLKRFPLDCLKVDRSFVADITGEAHDEAIVRTIVALAHGLGMRVVAEGVETEEQLAMLRRLHCDEVQGYLLGRPAPPEHLLARLQDENAADHRRERQAWDAQPS
ncbi:putative bifunctional diguanylate cyclase/phosphodiesterase [Roseateles sp.]|uniref:putative bifunctional diguanylate cyclase/phosphodiesterase n=1 Tax=Roseateles sp. TaxID=1971397 RepID=UPI002E179CBE